MAKDFLKLQGDITLQRMTWMYLKAQKRDQTKKLESVEGTIIELLNEKYSNSHPDFIKAREAFENFKDQPLSRTMLSNVAPFLKEVLESQFEEKDAPFLLNASDLKLLSILTTMEKKSAVNGVYDHRFFSKDSPQSVLNFTKLINSSYKTYLNPEESALNIELEITGLEKVIESLENKLNTFLNKLSIPLECQDELEACEDDPSMAQLFKTNEDIEKLLWEALTNKLDSDDVLLEKLSYGELWPRVSAIEKTSAPETPFHSPTVTKSPDRISNPKMKPLAPQVIQEAGVIIEDPIGIILRDKTGRERAQWEKYDSKYIQSMAQAIVLNDKVFEVDGKLYDRRNGRLLSHIDALNFFPPKRKEEIKMELASSHPSIQTPLLKAFINGQESFLANGKLYLTSGLQVDPSVVIALELGKKLGITVSPLKYKSMGQDYLNRRANALKNNEPYFRSGNITYDSYTGRSLSSPFGRQPAQETDTKIDKNKRRIYETLSDSEVIRNFHREKPNPLCGYYGVIDKKKAMVTIYSNTGDAVFSSEVLIGAERSDQRTRWTHYSSNQRTSNASTGAGIYQIRPQDLNDSFNKQHFDNNILSFLDEKNQKTVFAIHQVPTDLGYRYTKFSTNNPDDRRISGGCANVKRSDFAIMKKWLAPNCKVYVLPEESGNKFIVRDGDLKLISSNQQLASKTNLYNFSSMDTDPQKIDIKITSHEANTQEAREFVKALEDEKSKLMSIYHLSNDEYNDLAMLAFGILGNESQFGKSKRLSVKENAQFAVITMRLLKTRSIDEALNTSRGLTQIKFLPEGPFKKHYPEITKENLINPRNSALATMGYLAEAAKQMRQIALQNKSDPSKLRITKENMMDFMGYIYQGGRGALTSSDYSKQATPEFNGYYRGLQRNMSFVEISQKIE